MCQPCCRNEYLIIKATDLLFSSLELIEESLGLGPDVELGVVVHQHYQVSVVNKPLKTKKI
jgi:hypothetical protein